MDTLTELKYELIRCERNRLLKNTDIYALPDFPHETDAIKEQWMTYRKNLRDLPNTLDISTITFDENNALTGVSWPSSPLS